MAVIYKLGAGMALGLVSATISEANANLTSGGNDPLSPGLVATGGLAGTIGSGVDIAFEGQGYVVSGTIGLFVGAGLNWLQEVIEAAEDPPGCGARQACSRR